MTVAARPNSRRSRPTPPPAIGQQNLAQAKQQADDDFRKQQLAEKTVNDKAKIDLEAQKLHVSHVENLGRMAADMFGSQMDAEVAHHQANVDAAVGHHQAQADVQAAQIQADAQPADDGS